MSDCGLDVDVVEDLRCGSQSQNQSMGMRRGRDFL